LVGNLAAANLVKQNVNKFFYSKNLCCYADTIHWENGELKHDQNFDCFGNALAILNGTAPKEISDGIVKGFNAAKTAFGYRNITPNYEFNRAKLLITWYLTCGVTNGAFLRNKPNRYQNSAIWPFVEIRVIDALKKLQATLEAEEAIKLMIERKGFNEFYDPITGEPRGSEGQLWTAAAVLSAADHCRFRQQKA